MVKSRCVFVSLLFRIVSRLNHFQVHPFMFSKVNVTLKRQFLGFYCPSNLGLWFNDDAFLYHYYLVLHQAWISFSYICSCSEGKCYIIKRVYRLLLSIKARIMVKSRCVFVSILFRIVSRLNHFQVHLFMFSKVNVTLKRQFLGFYCPSNLGLWFNDDAFLYHYYLVLHQAWISFSYICSCSEGKCYIIKRLSRLLLSIKARIMVKSRCVFVSILFRIVSRLNHFKLHLFMFSKVNVTLKRQFLGF